MRPIRPRTTTRWVWRGTTTAIAQARQVCSPMLGIDGVWRIEQRVVPGRAALVINSMIGRYTTKMERCRFLKCIDGRRNLVLNSCALCAKNRLSLIICWLTDSAQRKPATPDRVKNCGRFSEWTGAGSNRRHTDFQSVALPTELPVRRASYSLDRCGPRGHRTVSIQCAKGLNVTSNARTDKGSDAGDPLHWKRRPRPAKCSLEQVKYLLRSRTPYIAGAG